jgi:hypothetical protein
MVYSGVPQNVRARGGVAILIDNKWKTKIEGYTYINERLIILQVIITRGHVTIIGTYALEEGRKKIQKTFIISFKNKLIKLIKMNTLLNVAILI